MLTGRAKIEFDDWIVYELTTKDPFFQSFDFYSVPFIMQWGCYVDFFDCYQIECEVTKVRNKVHTSFYESNVDGIKGAWMTLDEARKEAVRQADELMNTREL